ncbi:helix-turn-helix domain-containing protein [Sulfurovum sp. CS9]|uniref:helix-turn-helix domain-containing protein n=1 Tax=Sulfurovum sp. CS9 TaxID=3391146 RepID=UPI0039E962B4
MITAIPLEKEIKQFTMTMNMQNDVGAASFMTDQSIHIIGNLPEDLYPFAYRGKSTGICKWHGNILNKNIIETKGDQNSVDGVTFDHADIRFILITKTLLLEYIKEQCCSDDIDLSNRMFFIDDKDVTVFLDIHTRILKNEIVSKDELSSLLLRILQNPIAETSSLEKSHILVQKTIDLMHLNVKSPLLISTLSEALEVNIRTLELAFKKEFKLSPKRYYKRLLLQSIETELRKRKQEDITVTSILEQYQIHGLSEFGLSFKNYFNKTPSQIGMMEEDENPFGWNESIFSEFAED